MNNRTIYPLGQCLILAPSFKRFNAEDFIRYGGKSCHLLSHRFSVSSWQLNIKQFNVQGFVLHYENIPTTLPTVKMIVEVRKSSFFLTNSIVHKFSLKS